MTIKIQMEQMRTMYSRFAVWNNTLTEYEYSGDVEKLKAMLKVQVNNVFPLPSGRFGNVLAVALEMQHYKGALFIIQNAKDLGIDLHSVSSEYGGREVWNAKQTFEFSKEYFDFEKIDVEKDEFYKRYPEYAKVQNANIDAALEIDSIFQEKENVKKF